MDKETLLIIADILNTLDRSNRELYDLVDILNVTPDEKDKITDSIYVIDEKLAQLKRASIRDLDEFIDVDYARNINRY